MAVLKPGDRIGACEILELIGKGGMGEVYRAHDTKLKRDVAAKVLPSEFAQDPERVARAAREAEVLASLNHANIAHIYGIEEFDGSHCLILEYVDGETLEERIRRAPLPLDEVLAIAAQIAAALGAAHERGIVHRDLKPGNVKITPGGQVKVLDFGLAKVVDAAPNEKLSQSPTMLTAGTAAGMILGTTAYMSPEQARGRTADPRSDTWAFGVVLYEMLTGKHTFPGDTVLEVLSSVLKSDPDWSQLPPETPVRIRALLRRCLQRDPARRLQHVADARLEIEDVIAHPDAAAPAVLAPPPGRKKERVFWVAAVMVAAIGAAVLVDAWREVPQETAALETRLQLLMPGVSGDALFAVSPDGRRFVFGASQDGRPFQLWLRDLASDTPRPLEGTEGGAYGVAWSPDSQSLVFQAEGKFRRIDVNGGPAQTIGENGLTATLSWGGGDIILFSRPPNIYRMSARGEDVREVLKAPEGQQYRWPSFLPDGKRFLFRVIGSPEVSGTYLASLDGTPPRKLLDSDANAAFVPPDRILFPREGALFQVRLDLQTSKLAGDPVMVAPAVRSVAGNAGYTLFSGATTTLAYIPDESQEFQLTWLSRSGTPTGVLGQPDSAAADRFRISPDGRFVAIGRTVELNSDLWVLDTARGIPNRVTSDPAREAFPVWSPDSKVLAFHANPKSPGGKFDLYRTEINGIGDELLLETPANKNMSDWSPDGRSILFEVQDPKTDRDLWVLSLDSKRPVLFAQSSGSERFGRFSPNGRWVAYNSTENGRSEIYIQPFPGPGRSRRLTDSGGSNPVWTRNGQEISYIAPDGAVMAMPVRVSADNLESESPMKLFTLPAGSRRIIDATPDGQKFLALVPVDTAVTPPINIILNWMNALR